MTAIDDNVLPRPIESTCQYDKLSSEKHIPASKPPLILGFFSCSIMNLTPNTCCHVQSDSSTSSSELTCGMSVTERSL